MSDNSYLETLGQTYGSASDFEDVTPDVGNLVMVTLIETNTTWDKDGNFVRELIVKQDVQLCGDAPIIPFEDTLF